MGMDLEERCETMPTEFDCEPVEQLSEMEVDDIVINDDDDLKMDEKENDLYPIANNPFVETIRLENDNFIEGNDRTNNSFIAILLNWKMWTILQGAILGATLAMTDQNCHL